MQQRTNRNKKWYFIKKKMNLCYTFVYVLHAYEGCVLYHVTT